MQLYADDILFYKYIKRPFHLHSLWQNNKLFNFKQMKIPHRWYDKNSKITSLQKRKAPYNTEGKFM